jgi:hypothetical protein
MPGRPVQVGHTNGLETEPLGGRDESAAVVLHPSDRIQDGAAVAPR